MSPLHGVVIWNKRHSVQDFHAWMPSLLQLHTSTRSKGVELWPAPWAANGICRCVGKASEDIQFCDCGNCGLQNGNVCLSARNGLHEELPRGLIVSFLEIFKLISKAFELLVVKTMPAFTTLISR